MGRRRMRRGARYAGAGVPEDPFSGTGRRLRRSTSNPIAEDGHGLGPTDDIELGCGPSVDLGIEALGRGMRAVM
jgi:hypothetical protein